MKKIINNLVKLSEGQVIDKSTTKQIENGNNKAKRGILKKYYVNKANK